MTTRSSPGRSRSRGCFRRKARSRRQACASCEGRPRGPQQGARAFTLTELLVTVVVLGLLLALGWSRGDDTLAQLQVEAATRRLLQGLAWGRSAAEESDQGCGLSLSDAGWQSATGSEVVPGCVGPDLPLSEGLFADQLQLSHNFADAVRFTANGLLIDGGTAVLGHPQTELVRCVVVSQPLGVVRVGRYAGQAGGAPSATGCHPDPNL